MTKFLFIFFLFNVCFYTAFSQTHKIDSLNKLIDKSITDTSKINLINKKVKLLREINLDSSLELANINIANAEKIKYIKGEADGRTELATDYCFKGDYISAEKNLRAAAAIYTRINDSAGFLSLYSGYGILYGMQSNYDRSIIFFKKAAFFADRLHNLKSLNTSYQNIATSYQMQSNFSQALIYYQKALKPAEQQNDINTQAYITLNMGMTFNAINDTLKAEQSFIKAINLARKAEIKNVEMYAYSNLASVYETMEKYQQAYDCAITATALGKETGDQGIEASALSRAATQLSHMHKFKEAEVMVKKAISIADSSKQPLNIYQANNDAASIMKEQHKYKEAIAYYEKAFTQLQQSDIYDKQVELSYAALSECCELTGNYQGALAAYKKSAEIKDSIRSKENVRKATELLMNYEFDKKQQIIKAEQQKKDEISRTRQTALIAGLALTLILAAVALYAFTNKRNANRALKQQKDKLELTLNELKTTQTQLINSEKMASLGELTAGIAHEIQNPLNFVTNFSEVNKELLNEMKDEIDMKNNEEAKLIANDVIDNHEKIHYHGKRADSIVKNMLQHSRKSTGHKEPADINALCDEYLRLSYHGLRAKDKNFNADFKTDFDESLSSNKINIVPQNIGRVLLNLFTNAFYAVYEKQKTADESYKPLVTVATKGTFSPALQDGEGLGEVEIIVKDNGNGIPQNIIDKIFQPFFTTKPTGHGTGLGLSLAYDTITKEHNGTIKAESIEGEGTKFIIQLPVSA